MNLLNVLKFSVTGVVVGGCVFYLVNELKDLTNPLELEKQKTIEEAQEIIVSSFVNMILENPEITLEDAILKFENAKPGISLSEFAESKSRIVENYTDAYNIYFEQAKDIIFFT